MAVSTSTLQSDVFTALRTLIIANKPSYIYDGDTYEYTLVSEYPRSNPTFPIVVLEKSKVKLSLVNLDGSGEDYELEIQLDFYAKEQHGTKAIEVGQQSLMSTFAGNITNFKDTDGLMPQQDFWEDGAGDTFQDKNQLINTSSSVVRFSLR